MWDEEICSLRTAHPRGTKNHLWTLLVKKSGSRADKSRGRCPMPCAPSIRENIPSSLQMAVRLSNGIRTPGSDDTVSNIARRGLLPLALEALMALLNKVKRSSSSIG